MTIPSNEKDLKGRPGYLDEAQQKAFDEFKQEVEGSFDDTQRKWFDDTTLLYVHSSHVRYMVASDLRTKTDACRVDDSSEHDPFLYPTLYNNSEHHPHGVNKQESIQSTPRSQLTNLKNHEHSTLDGQVVVIV